MTTFKGVQEAIWSVPIFTHAMIHADQWKRKLETTGAYMHAKPRVVEPQLRIFM